MLAHAGKLPASASPAGCRFPADMHRDPPVRGRITWQGIRVTDREAILTETGVNPRHIELELTETFLMQDPHSIAAVLHAVRDMGMSLASNYSRTGYSTLSHLRCFAIDILNIDRSLVPDITTHADGTSIVSAVIKMGQSLVLYTASNCPIRRVRRDAEAGGRSPFLPRYSTRKIAPRASAGREQ